MHTFDENLITMTVDSGKSGAKFSWIDKNGEIQSDVLTTIVKEIDIDDHFKGSAERIEYTNEDDVKKAYLIGGVDGDIRFDRSDTKLELKHELSIYTAIAKVLTKHLDINLDKVVNVALSVNVPLEDFKNKTIKESYIEKYSNKEITININDKNVTFKIVSCTPYYESQGALIRNLHLIDYSADVSHICVIDLGSKNDTQILFNKLSPVQGKNVMTDNGINNSLRELASKLYNEYKTKFTIPMVESLLTSKSLPNDIKKERIDELFYPIATKLVEDIKSNTDQLGLNTTTTKVLFTGGSSIVLEEYLKSAYTEYDIYFSQDARFDNCKGALIRALKKQGE